MDVAGNGEVLTRHDGRRRRDRDGSHGNSIDANDEPRAMANR